VGQNLNPDLPRRTAAGTLEAQAGQLTLFCLSHAGGNAGRFAAWSSWLPGWARVVPVDLPGHGRRLREPRRTQWQPLVADITAAISEQAVGAYAVFGHSLGALVGYEVCRAMEDRGRPAALLVPAARNGPSARTSHAPIHNLPEDQFLSSIERLGGTPANVLDYPDLLRVFLPVLRADMRLAEMYVRPPRPPLSCPIATFGGRRDKMTDEAGLLAWEHETIGGFAFTYVDGGHFFLEEPEFTRRLAARLARLPGGDSCRERSGGQ
jgi:medium-chain acyl-[acyl-carrier-protein] hydrolase